MKTHIWRGRWMNVKKMYRAQEENRMSEEKNL